MAGQRVAFVAGASRGIGRACARQLALAGFDVVLGARTVHEGEGEGGLPGSLDVVAGEVRAAGREALPCRLDVLDRSSCDEAVATALDRFGRVDVFVNSALLGLTTEMKLFADTAIEEYEQCFEANVIAPLYLVQLLLPSMRRAGGGLIVNISSGAGQNETRGLPGQGGWSLSYSVTKAAINRATFGLAKELRADNVAVVNVEPGVTATERLQLVATQLGLDPATLAVSVDVPGAVCAYIASHPTPMAFSGRNVDAPQFAAWANLVDAASLPYPYGPDAWGTPPVLPLGGAASGMEAGLPGELRERFERAASGLGEAVHQL